MPASLQAKPMQAFGLAILLEAFLLVGATVVLARATQVKPAISEPVTITLVSEEPPPPPPLPKPEPPRPIAKPQPQPRPKPQPKPEPAAATPASPDPAPVAPVPVVETPSAFTEPVKPAPLPPPPVTSSKIDRSLEYADKVRAAVQAAVFYPPAAAALRFSGRVRLEFHLRDAVPGEAKVLVTSGMGMIDRAALQSVQSARYPEPPADMRGSDRVYQVWVEFNR